ncbi:MAG: tetratricopeptide repeat protein [Treponema sp.]|nr:tetratricopeptide repeat protein [Treponema sp.]
MPGLSQLKQFNKDIQSLGDEITLRATRGEKPIVIPIPKGITVEDDSEDFVLGMPDNPKVVDNSNVDEDLSEITGVTSKKSGSSDSGADSAPSFEAPDMSSLLAPIDLGGDDSDSGLPDLSQFMDAPVEEEEPEIVEEEPEEVSVADMGLEALLAGAGFDGTEGTEEEPEPQIEEEPEPEPDALPVDTEEPAKTEPALTDDFNDFDISVLDNPSPAETPAAEEPAAPDFDLSVLGNDADSFDTIPEAPAVPEEQASDIDNIDDIEALGDIEELSDIEPLESTEETAEETPEDFSAAVPVDMNFDLDDVPADSFDLPDAGATDSFDLTDTGSTDSFDLPDAGAADNFDLPDAGSTESFDLPEMDEASFSGDSTSNIEDFDLPEDTSTDSFEMEAPSADSLDVTDDFSTDSFDDTASEPSVSDLFNAQDVELPDMSTALEDIPDYEGGESESGDEDVSDSFDTDFDSFDSAEGGEGQGGSEPLETFDTTGMEDMDFGIQETDAQLNVDTGSDDFELDDGKISMEGSDFEIPGFSDVKTAPATPKPSKKSKNLDEPDFSGAMPGAELPPNTLSDEQYKQFLKNLGEYPLNVRLAFEDLIVQDEFTDDAEFEIIEKILKKAPARQVASTLEKMLDTAIPVPRDFEHRTAEEYEAYKKSLAYQLKNKILPGLLMTVLFVFVSWGLFNFGKNCVYIPAKASKLYKQGYALLQADEYVQSQIKFDEAATYQLKKKWFFNFARGYREHKQYQRAADIYGKILIYFNHDKTAGLEYAQMELNDLANYERAEEIARREILDYHINDADGILMLGDIFLEWGTEKDPEKLDLAKEQYMQLIQLYKPNDLYNSRLMRYNIRSDNFQQVLGYYKMFEEQKKCEVSAEDWTELGGYLLGKLYGPIAPSEEYLRYQIEGLLRLLRKTVDMDKENPIAWYNLGNYYVQTNDTINNIDVSLKKALEYFNKAPQLKKRDIYKYIDTYRLLGENYLLTSEYLQAQEQFTEGISLFTTEKENAGFEGNEQVGLLYADLGNINYTIAGDYETAAKNYKNAVSLGYDNPRIRYRLGYISYKAKNYLEALGSFMKAGEANNKERNLLLAMANTLSLRNDDYAAEGYYEQLISDLDREITERGGSVYPQSENAGYDLVTTYLYAANNYGVTLYRLAKRTGNSQKNAQAIVQLQQSLRAWDSLTRDQKSLVRLEGSNLAQENIKYITHQVSEFEPAIYLDIPKNLTENEGL